MANARGRPGLLVVLVLSLALPACRSAVPGGQSVAGGPSNSGQPGALYAAGGEDVEWASQTRLPYEARLSLRKAVRQALRYSPVLGVAAAELDAKDAEALQARARRNPQLANEIENFGGSGDYQGFKAAETTIGLAQVIELGGKRLKRLKVAELDAALSGWDFEAARLKIATQTAQIFIDVLAGQHRRVILNEAVALNERFRQSVAARVKAGGVNPVELRRVDVEIARAKVRLAEERAELDVARRKLALKWGSQKPNFGRVAGSLASFSDLPGADRLTAYLEHHPDVARWAEEMARRQAVHRLERAQRVPNLTIGAGVRDLGATQDTAVVAKVAIDLPVFNRNRGNIEAAERRIVKGDREAQVARNALTERFVEDFGKLNAAEAKLRALRGELIPAAKAAYAATDKGYREGKFDLLRLIDAQRSLTEARLDLVNTRAAFHKARTRVEALVGRSLYRL